MRARVWKQWRMMLSIRAIDFSSSGMKISGNISRRQEALGAAETGIERAQSVLRANATNDWDLLLAGCGGGAVAGKGEILCDGATPIKNEPVIPNTVAPPPGTAETATTWGSFKTNVSYTVYVRNDPVETTANPAIDDEDKRVVIRSEGVGRDGLSFFAIEAVIAVTSPGSGAVGLTEQHLGGPTGGNSFKGTAIPIVP